VRGEGGRLMTAHPIVVVDVESTGLRTGTDIAVEVAWHDLRTGESGSFVPRHDAQWVLTNAEPRALEVNGYRDRLADAPQDDGCQARDLFARLDGATMAGSNPSGDADWLESLFASHVDYDPRRITPWRPWHHRLLDLSAYAAGVLGLRPAPLPGLWDVCTILGVDPEPEVHTAANGVAVTVACFESLFVKAGLT
jgi:hypothetical protein